VNKIAVEAGRAAAGIAQSTMERCIEFARSHSIRPFRSTWEVEPRRAGVHTSSSAFRSVHAPRYTRGEAPWLMTKCCRRAGRRRWRFGPSYAKRVAVIAVIPSVSRRDPGEGVARSLSILTPLPPARSLDSQVGMTERNLQVGGCANVSCRESRTAGADEGSRAPQSALHTQRSHSHRTR